MKIKKQQLFTVITSLLCFSVAHSQESTNSAGGDASGSGGTVAYSVGQIDYTSNSDASGTVSQGVQQAYEIFTLSTKEIEINMDLSVYPNPTTDNLTLQINDYNNEKWSYEFYDMQGKLVNSGQIIQEQTQVNTANLPAATYFIHVVNQEKKKVQSFKIVKTH